MCRKVHASNYISLSVMATSTILALALIITCCHGDKIIGLSCLEKSWMVAGIGVRHVRSPDKGLNETMHDYQVSIVCRDRLTSVYSEVKNATFSTLDESVATLESGFSDGIYEAVYYRTYDICFRPSLSPMELFSGDVYVHYIGSDSCPNLRQISIIQPYKDSHNDEKI